MKTTYRVIETDVWCDIPYVVICSVKGKGNTYVLMDLDELREFYFSDYTFKATAYTPMQWWRNMSDLNIEDAISVEEQIIFR